MTADDDLISQTHRLKTEAAQTRAQAIQSQISAAFTLCEMAKAEVGYGRGDVARRLLSKPPHTAETIAHHLDTPNHVPPNQVDQLHDELVRLESQIHSLEHALHG